MRGRSARPSAPSPDGRLLPLVTGPGTFPVSALRYLTEALYEPLILHNRDSDDPGRERAVVQLLGPPAEPSAEPAAGPPGGEAVSYTPLTPPTTHPA